MISLLPQYTTPSSAETVQKAFMYKNAIID